MEGLPSLVPVKAIRWPLGGSGAGGTGCGLGSTFGGGAAEGAGGSAGCVMGATTTAGLCAGFGGGGRGGTRLGDGETTVAVGTTEAWTRARSDRLALGVGVGVGLWLGRGATGPGTVTTCLVPLRWRRGGVATTAARTATRPRARRPNGLQAPVGRCRSASAAPAPTSPGTTAPGT